MFILGTDTDVGKTIVSGALLTGLVERAGRPSTDGPVENARYWKPVQAGLETPDDATIGALCPHAEVVPNLYRYAKPASPDQADEAPQHPVVVAAVMARWQQLAAEQRPLLVEGAGGLMVPLNHRGDTWLDVLELAEAESAQPLPIILVARSGLGTLNHTILTIEALQHRGMTPVAVVLNGDRHEPNMTSLQRRFPSVSLIPFAPISCADGDMAATKAWQPAGTALWNAVADAMEQRLGTATPWSALKPSIDQDSLERHCWHPYTQHKTAPRPRLVAGSRGAYYLDREERGGAKTGANKTFDGMGSWWVNTVGHGRGEIAEAVAQQMRRNDHSIFAAASHEPALRLAKRMTDRLGHGLNRVFFTDNGSCAVEVGLKMAYQGLSNVGQGQRKTFIALKGAYHGDTFGTMAVGGMPGFHGMFAPFLFDVEHIAPVTTHPCGVCPEPDVAQANRELDALFAARAHELCGVVLEPFIQGAGGMLFQHPDYLKHLAGLAKAHGVPLIFDEVFTGMGRLGSPFAFHQLGIVPDIICLAKGLTGGTMPLALTVATDEVFERFWHDDAGKALLHGHSFTANPTGCAAALATLDIYDREDLWYRGGGYETIYKAFLAEASAEQLIENGRCHGSVMALELYGSGVADYFSTAALDVVAQCYELGLFIRPLGNTIYLAPPLSLDESELSAMVGMLHEALRAKRP